MSDYIELLKIIVSWPVLTLILVICFKNELKKLLKRIKKAWGLEWGTIPYKPATEDNSSMENTKVPLTKKEKSINSEKVGNIFWLGHDLMWTMDVILRSAPKNSIIHGYAQSLHHYKEIGIQDTEIEKGLLDLLNQANSTQTWNPVNRAIFAEKTRAILENIGRRIVANQENFKPRPKQ